MNKPVLRRRRRHRPADEKQDTGGHPPAPATGPASETAAGPDTEHGDGPATRARRGRNRLLVATALFATLILPKVVDGPGHSDDLAAHQPSPGTGQASSSASPAPGSTPGSAPDPAPSSAASPTPGTGGSPETAPDGAHPPGAGPLNGPDTDADADSPASAFRSVRAGQCLTVHANGTGWSRPAPTEATRVPCGDDRAFTRVTAVHRAGPGGAGDTSCPVGNGRATWSMDDTTLCVTRQFRTGQCLLAESTGGEMRAALMSAPACSSRPPAGQGRYDRLLTVTGVYDDDTTCREGDAGTHDRYWTWQVDGGSRTLCTADATG